MVIKTDSQTVYVTKINSKIYIMTSKKDRLHSANLEASSSQMAEGVPNNNQRGRRSGPCCFWGGLDKTRHIVSTAWLVRVQLMRQESSVHGFIRAKHKTYSPLGDHWVIMALSKAFNYFRTRRDKIDCAFDSLRFLSKITVKDWMRDSFWPIFLKQNITKFRQKNFPNVFQSLWYL